MICTSSATGLYGNAGQINYGVAKAGIAAFTVIAAIELARYGVTVNAIAPMALTRMNEDLPFGQEVTSRFAEGFSRWRRRTSRRWSCGWAVTLAGRDRAHIQRARWVHQRGRRLAGRPERGQEGAVGSRGALRGDPGPGGEGRSHHRYLGDRPRTVRRVHDKLRSRSAVGSRSRDIPRVVGRGFLVTRRRDGSPTTHPLTPLWADGAIHFNTYRKSAKVRDVLRHPRVSCVVTSADDDPAYSPWNVVAPPWSWTCGYPQVDSRCRRPRRGDGRGRSGTRASERRLGQTDLPAGGPRGVDGVRTPGAERRRPAG